MRKNKGGQITIFVILALIIVVVIALIFLLIKPPSLLTVNAENPNLYIQSCVKEQLENGIDIISKQGGDINPSGSIIYGENAVAYLCYTSNYYETCVNQRPLLIEHIEEELKNYITPKINSCFEGLRTELEKKWNVELGNNMDFNVSLKPKQVVININRDLKITNSENSQSFNEFNVKIISPVYDLAEIASGITDKEAQYCNFDLGSFMLLNKDYEISKNQSANYDDIYTVKERASDKKFTFAIRNCLTL
jgi:hypothetical protein